MPRLLTSLRAALAQSAFALLLLGLTLPAAAAEGNSATLRARQNSLAAALANSPYGEPLVIDSRESDHDAAGDVHALMNHGFAALSAGLQNPRHWCDILILHLNTKHCRVTRGADGPVLSIWVGTKTWQELDQASRVDLKFRLVANTRDYLQVELFAGEGPLSTSNYRILVEATPTDATHSFLHLQYSYDFGFVGRLAMQAYLATVARDKVGFTIIGRDASGPRYIGGTRGVIERNTMRYYLAIDAWLGAPGNDPGPRLAKWFAGTERFSRQLAELDRVSYFDMKRRELERQRSLS